MPLIWESPHDSFRWENALAAEVFPEVIHRQPGADFARNRELSTIWRGVPYRPRRLIVIRIKRLGKGIRGVSTVAAPQHLKRANFCLAG
jgi:hypothetical protein